MKKNQQSSLATHQLRSHWDCSHHPFSSITGSHRSPESSPLGSGHTLSCPSVLSYSAPQTVHCALWPNVQTVTGNFCVFKLLWTPPALCYFDSLPNTGMAFSLSSGSVFCPTSLLPEPWVLNSVTSSQFLPPASAIHVCGSAHSGLKTWVQSQRATQWKERIYSCELFSDLYMTSVACVFLASVQTTCLLVQTYMEAKYQYT